MPIRAPVPYETVTAIRAAYLAGTPLKVIASDFDMSDPGIFTADLPQHDPNREARRLKIVVCLDAGLDVRETAEKCGCKPSDVMRIIRAAKRAEPPPVPTPEEIEADKERKRAKQREYHARHATKPVDERTRDSRREATRRWRAKRKAAKLAAAAITVPAPAGLKERILDAALPPES